jgi:hypothetical protein
MAKKAPNPSPIDSAYRSLFRLGGAAAWIAAILILTETMVFVLYPQPGTIEDWFQLFQGNPLIGLLDAWLLEVPLYVMFVCVFLALFVLLLKTDTGWAVVALALALLGIGVFFATNNPFGMLSLSNQHATAVTEASRSQLLAAGQALLTNSGQRAIGGFNLGLFMVSIAGLILSLVMLLSTTFSRSIALWGILANAFSLADYLRQALAASPLVALAVILPYTILLIIWFIQLGRRLCQLGRRTGKRNLRKV